MTLHVVHDGPRSAPPLLLLHGSGASAASWDPMIPALATERYVIRMDLPGHGASPPAPSYRVADQAAAVAAELDRRGLTATAVAGHSSGGYIATALAEQRPGLVRSLALVSTGPSAAAFRRQPLVLRALLAPPFGPLLWAVRTDAMTRRGIGATLARAVPIPDGFVAGSRQITYRAMSTVLRRNSDYIEERTVPHRLAGLGIPVLAVFGAADPRWDPGSVHEYEVVPGARIAVLDGVGHVPMLEAPEPLAGLLLGHAT
ncbi:alpha/beta fold hydrolase [Actinoplanes sp. DH11]|uniref:alpha/beta fold hydrolase n=1 Tax=Actinoplanes sp. DH11 TaxID=2857011 RepID=UPI001E338DA1|nr:alpha/beta fold hydrolase [Actinoplanes sp. DH11]